MSTSTNESAPRSRGPIPRLDRETILDAGIAIAKRPGTKSVTVRELGTALGADPTAVYRHFQSKDALLEALLDRLTHMARAKTLANPADPEQWKTYLFEMSGHVFDTYGEHPSLAAEATRLSSRGVEELQIIEDILTAFTNSGLDRQHAVDYYGVLTMFTLSVSSGVAHGSSSESLPANSYATDVWVNRSLNVGRDSHPHIHSARDQLLELQNRQIFDSGLSIILDSAEQAGRVDAALA